MKWLDDAKQKAQELADEAAQRATQEAGKAAAKSAWSELERRVGSIAEDFVSAAEGELGTARAARGLDADGKPVAEEEVAAAPPPDVPPPAAEPEPAGPTPEQRAAEELARLKAARPTVDDEDVDITPVIRPPEPAAVPRSDLSAPREAPRFELPPRRDPMEAAHAALRAAAQARGGTFDPEEDLPPPRRSSDPLSAAQAALERAAAARAAVGRNPAMAAREDRARAELERLKSGRGAAPSAGPVGDDDDPQSPAPGSGSGAKKRSL